MSQAIAQGAVFGRDIIFTYGPYASIFTRSYHPATDRLMVWGSLYLGVSFGLAAVLIFRQGKWYLQLLLLLALAGIMTIGSLLLYYPLLAGAYVFRSTSAASEASENALRRRLLLVALFSPFGLLPLIKGTLVVLCAAIVALSVVLLAIKRNWKSAILVGIAPLISMPVLWVCSGQPLSGLPSYFAEMLPIIAGYTEAMLLSGKAWEIVFYLFAAAVLLWAAFRETKATIVDKVILVLMFATVLFMAFKEGFVRHDSHALGSGEALLLAALLLGAICDVRRVALVLFLAFFVWFCDDAHYVRTSSARFLGNIANTYESAWNGIVLRLADRGKLQREFQTTIARLDADFGFPMLQGTTDIYSYEQAYLISSGNTWNPRPMPQSYAAYNPALIEKNRLHLLDKNAPDNLIFAVEPIDDRFPSLDDGASWPVVLSEYEPTAIKERFLFLGRHKSVGGPSESVISSGKHLLGEVVELPAVGAPVFVRVNIRPSFLGRLATALFKPSKLKIIVDLNDGSQREYRIISGMAKTGFLLSPLIESTSEFGRLYAGASCLKDKNVKSFTIHAKRSWLWDSQYEVELVALDLPLRPEAAKLFGPRQSEPEESKLGAADCTAKWTRSQLSHERRKAARFVPTSQSHLRSSSPGGSYE